MIFDIKGVVAPVFTPTNDEGHLNLSIIPEYMQYLVDRDVHTVLVGGTTGEYVTLSLNERKQVLEAWLAAAKPLNAKVIAQVGGVPLPDVIEMAKYAEAHRASAIMTLPELYYKPKTTDQLVSYLKTVSEAAPTLPLLYYHFPMMSGVDVNIPELFTKASSGIPNFKGMKGDLEVAVQVTDFLAPDQRIFIANHIISPAVLLGHESSIATVTNMFPQLVQDVVKAAKEGDVMRVREYQNSLNRLVGAIVSKDDFLPAMKCAMMLITGLRVGPPRKPLTPLDERRKDQVAQNLSKMKINVIRDNDNISSK